jgi:ankyrin repeat protein
VIGTPGHAQSIFDAVSDGDLERVRALVFGDRGLVHLKDNRLNTPLHIAVSAGEKEIAEFLIENGADINAQDDLGRTPLHRATYFRPDLEMIDLLIQHGSNPNILNNDGNPAVSNAIDGTKIDAVK